MRSDSVVTLWRRRSVLPFPSGFFAEVLVGVAMPASARVLIDPFRIRRGTNRALAFASGAIHLLLVFRDLAGAVAGGAVFRRQPLHALTLNAERRRVIVHRMCAVMRSLERL